MGHPWGVPLVIQMEIKMDKQQERALFLLSLTIGTNEAFLQYLTEEQKVAFSDLIQSGELSHFYTLENSVKLFKEAADDAFPLLKGLC